MPTRAGRRSGADAEEPASFVLTISGVGWPEAAVAGSGSPFTMSHAPLIALSVLPMSVTPTAVFSWPGVIAIALPVRSSATRLTPGSRLMASASAGAPSSGAR